MADSIYQFTDDQILALAAYIEVGAFTTPYMLLPKILMKTVPMRTPTSVSGSVSLLPRTRAPIQRLR